MIPSRYRGTEKTQKEINTVLDRIRAEIDQETRIQVKHYTNTDAVIDEVLDVIDKYKGMSDELVDHYNKLAEHYNKQKEGKS